ncbi:MAG: hypothetical protein WBP88_07655 [Nitrososphaeraceae archaeon]
MSTVSVYLRHIYETTSKPQPRTKPSLRHDYFVIMAASSIFLGIVLITMLMVIFIIVAMQSLLEIIDYVRM